MRRLLARATDLARRRPLLFLAALSLVAHVWSIPSYFMADDFLHVQTASKLSLTRPGELFRAFDLEATDLGLTWYTSREIRIRYFRPLATALFVLDYHLYGLNPLGYHVTNILLNALNTWLVFLLALRLLPSRRAALLAGAVFAVHATTNEAVNWISGRTDLLAVSGMLAAVLLFLRALDSAGLSRLAWSTAAGATLAAGLLSKESAIVAPALCVVAWLVRPSRAPEESAVDASLRRGRLPGNPGLAALSLLPQLAVIAIYLPLRSAMMPLASKFPPSYYVSPLDPRFFREAAIKLAAYISHYVFFLPLDAFVSRQVYLRNWPYLFVGFLAALGIIFLLSRRMLRGPERWLLLWPLITLGPSLLVFLGKRFLYSATTGVALLLGIILHRALNGRGPIQIHRFRFRRRRIVVGYLALLLIFLWLYECSAFLVTGQIEQWIDEIVAQTPRLDAPAEFHFADLWFPMGLGLDHALQLRYGRDDITVHVWSIFLMYDIRDEIELRWLDPRTAELTVKGDGIFGSDPAVFFLWGDPPPSLGQTIDLGAMRVTSIAEGPAGISTIRIELADDGRQRVFYRFEQNHPRRFEPPEQRQPEVQAS
jgi:hypothetical protein